MSETMSTAEAAAMLGCSPPTVTRLIGTGTLRSTREPRGTRFAHRIDQATVRAHLRTHGRYDKAHTDLNSRVAALEAAAPPADGTATETAALRARIADLEAVMALGRMASETNRAADEARGEALRLVTEALVATERADALRRDAAAQLEDALGTFTRPTDGRRAGS